MYRTAEEIIKKKLKDCKNAHFLLVDGMSKLFTHEVLTCRSSVFQCSGFKWILEIDPSKDRRNYLCLSLRIKDVESLPSEWEVICRHKPSVVSQTRLVDYDTGPYEVNYNEEAYCYGNFEFISHKELERYTVDDKAIFCVDINEVKPNFPVTSIGRTIGTANRLRLMEVAREKAKFTWKITQFSSFDGEEHSSYEFTVGPRRWKLEMYPKGKNKGKENSLSLYLNASDFVTNDAPKEETLVVYKFRVLDQFRGNHHEGRDSDTFGYNESCGIHKFLPLGELHDPRRGLLVNDQIYMGVEFLLVGTNEYL